MTVCIASMCYESKCIIGIEDSMLSMSDMSADKFAVKHSSIGGKWLAMFAGNDVSLVVPILNEVRGVAKEESCKETLEDIVSAFQEAFKRQIIRKAEIEVLFRFNLNMAEFF
jgi:hypothetical protein